MADLWIILLPLWATGLVSGFMAGLLGVGGGLVIVPIVASLLMWTGINTVTPMHMAIATSLAVIVPTSILSAYSHMKLGNVDFAVVKRLAPFVFMGALGGGLIVDHLDNASLKVIFGALAICLSLLFLYRVMVIREGLPAQPLPAILGGALGIVAALVGIGGGAILVPLLSSFGWQLKRAVGSAALMGLFVSLPGMLGFIFVGWDAPALPSGSLGYVYLPAALIVASSAFFTAPLGARMASRIDKNKLRRIFAVFLMIVGSRLIYDGLISLGYFI